MIDAGVTATNVCVTDPSDDFQLFLKRINRWYEIINRNNDKVILSTSVTDIEKAKKEDKVAIILGTQHPNPISNDLDLLCILHEMGLRVFGIAYQRRGFIGDGCGERTDCGLSKFGIKVIEKMNELGMLIDLSHAGYKTTIEAIEVSRAPVIFTYTYPRTLNDHIRNKSDEQIRALAKKDGIIGIAAYSLFAAKKKGERPTINHFLNAIDYVVKLVGVDYVGIGLDLGPLDTEEWWNKFRYNFPELGTYDLKTRDFEGLNSVSYLPDVTEGLVKRGYLIEDIEKIIGGNFLRLFRKVWKK
jgi:membrane dipeptidase